MTGTTQQFEVTFTAEVVHCFGLMFCHSSSHLQAISRKVRGGALTAASMAKARDMCSTRRDGVSDVWSLLESKPQSYKCETLIGKE